MAFGDVGGNGTELIVTCRTSEDERVSIAKGDAVILTGDYEVNVCGNSRPQRPVFGRAMADATNFAEAIPIKVQGICVFGYEGNVPIVDGKTGVVASTTPGKVKVSWRGAGSGINVKVDEAKKEVHVLL